MDAHTYETDMSERIIININRQWDIYTESQMQCITNHSALCLQHVLRHTCPVFLCVLFCNLQPPCMIDLSS